MNVVIAVKMNLSNLMNVYKHKIKCHPLPQKPLVSTDCLVFVFESVHVRSVRIYAYFMVAIIVTIFIMILNALSHKMVFAVSDVQFGF